jgi:hypothetical protein
VAVYNFTDSWDNETFTVDGSTVTFTQAEYTTAINASATANGGANNGLQDSFGSAQAGGYNILNFGDFDYNDDSVGDWSSMNSLVGDTDIVGGYAVAIDAEGEGFIQVTSNFNGYNSFGGTSDGDDGILFDIWHLDGLDDGDYVTAQVISGTLTDAYLSVYGEVDSFETASYNGNQVAWPYLQDDLLTVDTNSQVPGAGLDYGALNYTMTIVTDWKQCSVDQMESFDWGTMDFYGESDSGYETWYSDIDWGYVQYSEYTTASYQSTLWNEVQGSELDKNDLKVLMKADKTIDGISDCDLDINVLKKKTKNAEMTGDASADIFLMKGKALKKQKGGVDCAGGQGSDTFVLQKAKKSNLVIENFKKSEDYINTSFIKGNIKLQVKKGDTLIKKGKDLLAVVEDTKGLTFTKGVGIS